MELFDKKYVHFMWDYELEGKEGFFADNINVLKSYVEDKDDNRVGSVSVSDRGDFPFCNSRGSLYRFFYYDPLYEYKRAYSEGKIIQIKDHIHNNWVDIKHDNILWGETAETGTYRINPEPATKRMTYRQLAEWLAKGNGQAKTLTVAVTHFAYDSIEIKDEEELPEEYKIRKWGSDEWIEPTEDVYNDAFETKEHA